MDIGDDKELFEQAMTDEPAEAPAETEPVKTEDPQPESSEQPRDENGRFAKKEADEPDKPDAMAEEKPVAAAPEERQQRSENRIPLAEHLSVRERAQRAEQERDQERQRREDLERRLQALERQKVEKPEEAPDIWANPEAFIDQRMKAVQQQAESGHERVSKLLAVEKFGAEAVDAAFEELKRQIATNPGARFEHQRIMASDHPYGELVAWHKRQAALKEIGEDPEAYKAKLRDELKNDPEFVKTVIATARQSAQPGKGAPQAIDLPPSLNRTTGSGGQVAPSAPQTEAEIFQEIFSR
jgi:hypothetical protein